MRVSIVLLAVIPAMAGAMDLKPETIDAWNDYIETVQANMRSRARHERPFLWIDEQPGQLTRVRGGEILVAPASDRTPQRVPSGLIHDWIGVTFIPNATLEEVTGIVRDYDRYKDFYRPHVTESKALVRADSRDRFSLVLVNRAALLGTAIDSDYETRYCSVDANRMYSISQTTRVQEIANDGQPSARMLPVDRGSGYIWRLYSVMRFEERDGGVYLEVEAIALSRDIPAGLRWFVDPIVRSVSRSALNTSLRQTQAAVAAHWRAAAAN